MNPAENSWGATLRSPGSWGEFDWPMAAAKKSFKSTETFTVGAVSMLCALCIPEWWRGQPKRFQLNLFFPMRNQCVSLCLAVALLGLMNGCKKAEQPGGSKTGVLLQAKWPVGNRYVFRLNTDQQTTTKLPQMPNAIQQHLNLTMTYAIAVLKEGPDGGRELEIEFLANEVELKTGDQAGMKFDSKDNPTNDDPNPMATPFRKMVGSKVRLQTDASGKVDKIIGLEDWISNLASDDAGQAGQMMSQQFNEGFLRQIGDFGQGLPTVPVDVGQTWPFKLEVPAGAVGKVVVEAKTTLKRWEDHEQRKCAVLDSKGTLKSIPGAPAAGPMGKMSMDKGHLTATTWFDAELGMPIESISDQTMRVKGDLPGQKNLIPFTSGFTVDIIQRVTVKLVESGKTKE